MPRYIDADVAKIDAEDRGGTLWLTDGDVKEVKRFLDDQPTADVAPIVHAHWKYIGMMPDASYIYECSKCGRRIFIDWTFLLKDYPSCHCGARMDEVVKKMERNKLFAIKAGAMNNDEKAQLCAILIKWGYTVRLVEVTTNKGTKQTVVEYWREQ